MTKRACLYARVSRDDRHTDGRNLESQLAMCREHAAERGYAVVAELAEDERGVSGARLDAPQLQRAFALAESGAFDVLVVREMDRLARDLAKQLIVERRLRAAGADIDYVLGDYPDSPEGALMKNVRAVVAEYERLKIVERTTRGIHNYVKAGNVWCGAHHPYGYRETETDGRKTLRIHEPEAYWVRQMFEWYCRGDDETARLSLRAIARKLRAAGVLSPADKSDVWAHKRKGRAHWAATSVRQILTNEAYTGRWTFSPAGGEPIVVEVPAIINRATFDAAQRRFKENLALARRNVKYDYLLRGRLFCKCGYRMHGRCSRRRDGRTYFYYRCPAANRSDLAARCDAKMIRVDKLDPAVWELITAAIADLDNLRGRWERYQTERARGDAPQRAELSRLDGEIAEQKRRLERLIDLRLDGVHARETVERRSADIEARLDELRSARARVVARVNAPDEGDAATLLEYAAMIRDRLDGLSGHVERRWVVDKLDVRVRVTGDGWAAVTARGDWPLGEVEL